MKRILHVLYSLERSGMEKMLANSSQEGRRHGYECDVLATAPNAGILADELRACGYGVHHLPFRSRLKLLPRLDFLWRFYALCRSGYDVVHIHTEAGPPLFVSIARIAGVRRIVLTPHNTFRFVGFLRFRKSCERNVCRFLVVRFGMISDGVKINEKVRFGVDGVRIQNWFDTEYFRPPSPEERQTARRSLGGHP